MLTAREQAGAWPGTRVERGVLALAGLGGGKKTNPMADALFWST